MIEAYKKFWKGYVDFKGRYFFASFIPSIALQVRRLRDAGFHWALIFLRFASFIGDIVLLVLCCQPTKVEFPFNNFNNLQQ